MARLGANQSSQEQGQGQAAKQQSTRFPASNPSCLYCKKRHRKCDRQKPVCTTCQSYTIECEWPEVKAKSSSTTATRKKTRTSESGSKKQLKGKEEEEGEGESVKKNESPVKPSRTKRESTTKKDPDLPQPDINTHNKDSQEEVSHPANHEKKQKPQQEQSRSHPTSHHSRSSPTPDSAYGDIYHVRTSAAAAAAPTSSSSKEDDKDGNVENEVDHDHNQKKRVVDEQPSSRKRRKVDDTTDKPLSPPTSSEQDSEQPVTAPSAPPQQQPEQLADSIAPEKEGHVSRVDEGRKGEEKQQKEKEVGKNEMKPFTSHHTPSLKTPAPKPTQPRRSLSRPSITPRQSLASATAGVGVGSSARGRRSTRLNKGYSSTEADEDSDSGDETGNIIAGIDNTRVTSSVSKAATVSSEKVDDVQGEESESSQDEPPMQARKRSREEAKRAPSHPVPAAQPVEVSQVKDESKTQDALSDSIVTHGNNEEEEEEETVQQRNQSDSTGSQQVSEVKPAIEEIAKETTSEITAETVSDKQSAAAPEKQQPKPLAKLSRAQRRKSARMQHLDSRPTSSASSKPSAEDATATAAVEPAQVKADDKGTGLQKVEVAAVPAETTTGESRQTLTEGDASLKLETHRGNAAQVSDAPKSSPTIEIHPPALTSFHEYAPEDEEVERKSHTDGVQLVDKKTEEGPTTETAVDQSEPPEHLPELKPQETAEPSRSDPQDSAQERTMVDVEMTDAPVQDDVPVNATAPKKEATASKDDSAKQTGEMLQRVLDQFVEADAGHIPDEESSDQGEYSMNPHYENMHMETRSLPADGPSYGPFYEIAGNNRSYNPYDCREGKHGENPFDEEGNELYEVECPPWNELTYEGVRRHAVYQRLDLEHDAGKHYHRNHTVNESRKSAWRQQYIDKLQIPLEYMNSITARPRWDFWGDYMPYLMNHYCLIPLYERTHELRNGTRPVRYADSNFSDFQRVKPVTMDVTAKVMRDFICLAISSLQQYPLDYERASKLFNVARPARDILFHCEPLVQVQAMILSVQYFMILMQYDEAWVTLGAAIRICQKERWDQPSGTRYLERIPREDRRRAWWACVLLERHLAIHMGLRPLTPSTSKTPLPHRQLCNLADDSECEPPSDLRTTYPYYDDDLDFQRDDPLMQVAEQTYKLTDLFFFKLYLEQACFIDRIIEIQDDLRFDGDLAKGIEKFSAFDMGKLRKLEQDMSAWKKKVPPHYSIIDRKQYGALPNEACLVQKVTLTWWSHYLRIRLTRPFFALVVSDRLHDTRSPNLERPKPKQRLDKELNEFDLGVIRQYSLQCFNSARVLVSAAVENTAANAEGRMESVFPRHLLIPFVYEATKILIISDILGESEDPGFNYVGKEELIDRAIVLLTEYYAAPPIGQFCAPDLEAMRDQIDQLINDDSAEVVNFPDPAILESLPYDLGETRTLP